jgi:hypothetical protein
MGGVASRDQRCPHHAAFVQKTKTTRQIDHQSTNGRSMATGVDLAGLTDLTSSR